MLRSCAPEGIRTPGLLIRSRAEIVYPVLWRAFGVLAGRGICPPHAASFMGVVHSRCTNSTRNRWPAARAGATWLTVRPPKRRRSSTRPSNPGCPPDDHSAPHILSRRCRSSQARYRRYTATAATPAPALTSSSRGMSTPLHDRQPRAQRSPQPARRVAGRTRVSRPRQRTATRYQPSDVRWDLQRLTGVEDRLGFRDGYGLSYARNPLHPLRHNTTQALAPNPCSDRLPERGGPVAAGRRCSG